MQEAAFREATAYLKDARLLRQGCVAVAVEEELREELSVSDDDELQLDAESRMEMELLAAMGMPLSFGGGGGRRERQAKGRRRSPPPPPPAPPLPLPAPPKYWAQRYRYFSRFDEGCQLDEEMWFSVTPETLARRQAVALGRPWLSIDAFAGCGGNAIALALSRAGKGGGTHVLSVDMCASRLQQTLANAQVYGCRAQLDCVLADWVSLSLSLQRAAEHKARRPLQADAVFLSPPWGGPDYALQPVFDIATPLAGDQDAEALLGCALGIAPRVALFMPRNTDSQQLLDCARDAGAAQATLESGVLNGKLKAKTLYARTYRRHPAASAD